MGLEDIFKLLGIGRYIMIYFRIIPKYETCFDMLIWF